MRSFVFAVPVTYQLRAMNSTGMSLFHERPLFYIEAIKYNVVDYILKPFNVPDVLYTVERCIERRAKNTRTSDFAVDLGWLSEALME